LRKPARHVLSAATAAGTRFKSALGATLVAASTPDRSELGDLSHLVEPNASDLKVRIAQKWRDASKSVRRHVAAMRWG
jgi:hypothetical protein